MAKGFKGSKRHQGWRRIPDASPGGPVKEGQVNTDELPESLRILAEEGIRSVDAGGSGRGVIRARKGNPHRQSPEGER